MNLKTAIYLLGAALLSTFFSCMGGSDPEEIYSPDAQITSFSIKGHAIFPGNDTVKNGLDAIRFSIDQINSQIFNRDSAKYGLQLTKKVIVTFSTASGANLLNITNGDSVVVQSGDSIDLRKPVILRSYALTGDKKEYTVKLNIHTVDPDSIGWKQVNSNVGGLNEIKMVMFNDLFYYFVNIPRSESDRNTWLFVFSDESMSELGTIISDSLNPILSQMQQFKEDLFVCTYSDKLYTANIKSNFSEWTQIPSEYPVKNVFGVVDKINVLALAVEKNDTIVSAAFDGKNWKYGDKLPDRFPTQDFSSLSYTRANTGHLTIAGGETGTSWSTTDGLYWAQIGNLPFNLRKANVFRYDNKFYLLNGIESTYNTSVYTSVDQAVTWQLAPSKVNLPKNYTSRTGADVVVDSDNMIYIIGGRNEGNPVNDIWKGRLNKLN